METSYRPIINWPHYTLLFKLQLVQQIRSFIWQFFILHDNKDKTEPKNDNKDKLHTFN